METKENIHEGHRKRLLELVYKAGIENVSDIQAVEFILTYVFPRGDVNPLAHRLLDRYDNIATILEAPVQDLQRVRGMGEASAIKLHMLLSIFERYSYEKGTKQNAVATMGEIFDYLTLLLRHKTDEEFHMIAVTAEGEVIGDRCLAKGNIKNVSINYVDITLFLATYKTPAVILVHNHPKGTCSSSEKDDETTIEIEDFFRYTNCKVLDNLVVGTDGIYSLMDKTMRKRFTSTDNDEFNDVLNGLN